MNKKLLRRFIGLLLTALLLVGVFVLAATSAAKGSNVHELVGGDLSPPTHSFSHFVRIGNA
jgi:hypothetical protein